MSSHPLKDANHRIIGYLETRSDGVQVIKDSNFHVLGYYEPGADVTQDATYRIVGYGNLLTMLLGR